MKKWIMFLLVTVLLLSGCSGEPVKEITNVAQWEEWTGELIGSEVTTLPDGKTIIRVYVVFTNNSEEGLYLYQCFGVQAYQDGVEMVNLTDINETDANTIVAIKNGKSITGSYAFELRSDSPVEIELHSPTADSVLLAKKIYEIEN